ncbi:pectin esterase [Pedobacter sp. SD-b]|uniref:Pectinesterase n=1 Tax=Pedobacter segetis TaxID=2793069 RepID=A0ABS1BJN4_9SPHI|nr:pectinesterase family protein [Pedobacter segetis]MBK0383092.1 pectin esterase [Pedobacter segetis]
MKKTLILLFLGVSFSAFSQTKLLVSQSGDGNFKTVQKALDAVPINNTKTIIIYIKNGIYKEKLQLDSTKNKVTLIGEDQFKTILTFDDHPGKVDGNGKSINTQSSYSFLIAADDFSANNITFQNDAGFTAGQAVALEVRGDKAVFKNCRVVGNQDILFLNSVNSRQYYEDCYLEGTTDFIFGAATAWFQNCHIHSKKNSHITAASTPKEHAFGLVFYNCVVTADTSLNKVSLGRPWRPYANVAYLHCYLPEQVKPEGWSVWNKLDTYTLSRFSEYENYGPGANPNTRVSWSRQLTSAEAKNYNLENVLRGWKPE